MENKKDNIELRSEKVRNIIGQIPSKIIRMGISTIFFIVLGLLIGTYYFKYQYTIETTALINQENNNIVITIQLPANEIINIKPGNTLAINFNNIPYLYNEILETKIQDMPNKLTISNKGGFFQINVSLPNNVKTNNGKKLNIIKPTVVNAKIITEKISFFDRIIKPLKLLTSS